MNRDKQQLKIIQYNVQKSYPVMNTLLKDPKVLDYTVICIQEPWLNSRNSKQTHNPTQGNFEVFIADGNERPFVAFFVNKNRIVTQDIKVSGRGPFHATIRIMTEIEGRKEEIVIHNVYNPNEKYGTHDIGRDGTKVSRRTAPYHCSRVPWKNTTVKKRLWLGTLTCTIASGTVTTIEILGIPPQLKQSS